MRNIIPFVFLLSSCWTNSASEQEKKLAFALDSMNQVDSMMKVGMAKTMSTDQTKKDSVAATSFTEKEINPNDFPFFSSYPKIVSQGKSVKDFIPEGWMIRDSVSSDLNGDARKDFAIVLQKKDSVRMVDFANDFVDTLLTQPRMVIVILCDGSDSHFNLSAQNNFFIPNHDRENMEDPFESVSVTKGVLQFSFQYFANAGSYEVSNMSYKFRYQDGDFVLIGGDYSDFMRNMGDMEECSYNFLTKKMKWTTGENMFDESKKGKVDWETIEMDSLRTLDKMQPAGTWEVKKGHYL